MVKADTAYPWQVTPKIAARGMSERIRSGRIPDLQLEAPRSEGNMHRHPVQGIQGGLALGGQLDPLLSNVF